MSSIEKIKDKATQTSFNKKVIVAAQQLHPYVKHRLYIAESKGIIPKNMYNSSEIIDEGIAVLYKNGYDIDVEKNVLKLKLFKIVDVYLDSVFKKEAFHKNTISTQPILESELDQLDETYTIDSDLDYIMNEDLTDISYKQNQNQKRLFLYNENEEAVLEAFEINDISKNQFKTSLGKFYSWIPMRVSSIIDLHVFGKLNFDEIASIKDLDINRIETILKLVKQKFRDTN
jgi:hypothetical protein